MSAKYLTCCFSLCLTAFLSGCGDGRPTLVPASGTVTLNGEPLEGAQVGLQPVDIEGYSRPSRATTDAQGKFSVGTYGKADGIPEGSYRVTVTKKDLVSKLPEGFGGEDPTAAGPIKYEWTTPMMYGDPETSGLSVEVLSSGISPDVIALTGEAETEIVGGRSADEP